MQQVTTLVSIGPKGRSSRAAMELFFRSARRLQQIAGFRRLQGFRALDASDHLLLVLDWDPSDSTCAMELAVCSLVRQAEQLGLEVGPLEFMETTFDRCLLREGSVATLVRLSRNDAPNPADTPDRDDEYSLKALAAPGTIRLTGARTEDGDAAVCRIDFDSEDGIWHFLDSALRQAWSAQPYLLTETWALNLPRLAVPAEAPAPEWADEDPEEGMVESEGSLSVRLSRSENGETAYIRLEGHVDAHNCELTERFCSALLQEGCTRLRVDVSNLEGISADALLMLARTARSLKAVGGRFTLVDNARRVRRITRTKHLESVLI